ncbi:MAG: hypothetical protein WBD27_06965 [Pyrinomonadaceae bacterium]
MIKIRTKHPDGTDFGGIVLENKRSFVIIQQITSFEPDGIVIIPKTWIKGIRNGKFEKCANEIIRSILTNEGLVASGWHTELNTLEAIMAHLKANNVWPAVEVLYNGDASFYIGPVIDILPNSFKIHSYDASGKWEKKYELEYKEVFKVEINSSYVKNFNEYMQSKSA